MGQAVLSHARNLETRHERSRTLANAPVLTCSNATQHLVSAAGRDRVEEAGGGACRGRMMHNPLSSRRLCLAKTGEVERGGWASRAG